MAIEFDDEDVQPVANALCAVARAIRDLGNGDAATHMGGLEALGVVFKDCLEELSSAQSGIADSADRIADAIDRHSLSIDNLSSVLSRMSRTGNHDPEQ